MTAINVYLSIPPPFTDDEYPMFQGVRRKLFNDIAGKEVFDVIIDEADLELLLADIPQIQVMEAFKPDGLRVGLTKRIDNTDPDNPVETIEGTPRYQPDASLSSGLKDHIHYDEDGNQVGATSRILIDDDTHRWFGWTKRDFIN